MAHLTGTLRTQRAQIGDTFTYNGIQYIAVQQVYSQQRPTGSVCRGCAFYRNGKYTCYRQQVPECVSEDVVFVQDHSPRG